MRSWPRVNWEPLDKFLCCSSSALTCCVTSDFSLLRAESLYLNSPSDCISILFAHAEQSKLDRFPHRFTWYPLMRLNYIRTNYHVRKLCECNTFCTSDGRLRGPGQVIAVAMTSPTYSSSDTFSRLAAACCQQQNAKTVSNNGGDQRPLV